MCPKWLYVWAMPLEFCTAILKYDLNSGPYVSLFNMVLTEKVIPFMLEQSYTWAMTDLQVLDSKWQKFQNITLQTLYVYRTFGDTRRAWFQFYYSSVDCKL